MAFLGDIGKSVGNFFNPAQSSQSSTTELDPAVIGKWNQLFSGASSGVAPWQQAGFLQAMNQALTKFSGSNAAAGGLTPGSLPQIASSAAQYVAPQFAELNTNFLANLMAMRQKSSNVGGQTGPGIGYNLVNSVGDNFAKRFGPNTSGTGKGFFGT